MDDDERRRWAPDDWGEVWHGIMAMLREQWYRRREALLWRIRTRLGYRPGRRSGRVDLESVVYSLFLEKFPSIDRLPGDPATGALHTWAPLGQDLVTDNDDGTVTHTIRPTDGGGAT